MTYDMGAPDEYEELPTLPYATLTDGELLLLVEQAEDSSRRLEPAEWHAQSPFVAVAGIGREYLRQRSLGAEGFDSPGTRRIGGPVLDLDRQPERAAGPIVIAELHRVRDEAKPENVKHFWSVVLGMHDADLWAEDQSRATFEALWGDDDAPGLS